MKAEITYNAGASYRIKAMKFNRGVTKPVTDSAVIKKCQATAGFSVRVLEEDKPAKQKLTAKEKNRATKVVEVEAVPKFKNKVKKDK